MICKINTFKTIVVLFLLITVFTYCNKVNEKVSPAPLGGVAITATLKSLQASTSAPTNAAGSLVGHFDKSTFALSFTVDWGQLSNVPTEMQLLDGAESPIVITGFSLSRNGTLYSSVLLPASALENLLSGNFYFVISTVTYPNGEIKGQITAK